MPKITKFGGDLTKIWQKQVGSFFGTPCSCNNSNWLHHCKLSLWHTRCSPLLTRIWSTL